jgi:hypothetical protein
VELLAPLIAVQSQSREQVARLAEIQCPTNQGDMLSWTPPSDFGPAVVVYDNFAMRGYDALRKECCSKFAIVYTWPDA